jgi:hypothetical protein
MLALFKSDSPIAPDIRNERRWTSGEHESIASEDDMLGDQMVKLLIPYTIHLQPSQLGYRWDHAAAMFMMRQLRFAFGLDGTHSHDFQDILRVLPGFYGSTTTETEQEAFAD